MKRKAMPILGARPVNGNTPRKKEKKEKHPGGDRRNWIFFYALHGLIIATLAGSITIAVIGIARDSQIV